MHLAFFLLNSNRFVLKGARRTQTGNLHDGTSTGSVTLSLAEGGAGLAGAAWPIALVYDAVPGNFHADIPAGVTDAAGLTKGQVLWYHVELTASDGKRYVDRGTARCRYPSG